MGVAVSISTYLNMRLASASRNCNATCGDWLAPYKLRSLWASSSTNISKPACPRALRYMRADWYVVMTAPPPSGTLASSSSLPMARTPEIPNLLSSSSCHCGISSFRQTTKNFEILFRDINSLATKPALIVFPSPTSSASKVTGKRRQKVIKFLIW